MAVKVNLNYRRSGTWPQTYKMVERRNLFDRRKVVPAVFRNEIVIVGHNRKVQKVSACTLLGLRVSLRVYPSIRH